MLLLADIVRIAGREKIIVPARFVKVISTEQIRTRSPVAALIPQNLVVAVVGDPGLNVARSRVVPHEVDDVITIEV